MAWSVVCLLASTPAQSSYLVHTAVALECNIYYLMHPVNITLLIFFHFLGCIQMEWIVFCLQFTVYYTVYSIMTKTYLHTLSKYTHCRVKYRNISLKLLKHWILTNMSAKITILSVSFEQLLTQTLLDTLQHIIDSQTLLWQSTCVDMIN